MFWTVGSIGYEIGSKRIFPDFFPPLVTTQKLSQHRLPKGFQKRKPLRMIEGIFERVIARNVPLTLC